MQQKENKIIEYIGIALAIYFIAWFWPILFGSRTQVGGYYAYNQGYEPSGPVYTGPTEVKQMPMADGYEDPGPTAPTNNYYYIPNAPAGQIAPSNKGCTMEAKICADGSAVGRTGPNCEFELCPEERAHD